MTNVGAYTGKDLAKAKIKLSVNGVEDNRQGDNDKRTSGASPESPTPAQ